jgi:hypothetical protein
MVVDAGGVSCFWGSKIERKEGGRIADPGSAGRSVICQEENLVGNGSPCTVDADCRRGCMYMMMDMKIK